MSDIVTDLGTNKNWKGWKGGHNQWVINFVQSGTAFSIADRVFTLKIYAPGVGAAKLTLTEGNGLTNGGASGLLTIVLTQTQSNETLRGTEYYYILSYVYATKTYRVFEGNLDLAKENNPSSATTELSADVTLAGASGFTTVTANVTLMGSESAGSSSAEDVSFTPAGNIAATDVQAAIEELDSEKMSASATASDIGSTAAGNIEATTVQDALNELDLDKITAVAMAIGGTGTAKTGTTVPSFAAYVASQVFLCRFSGTNTGAVTLNLNGIGAKALVKNGSQALVLGDITSSMFYLIAYDGSSDNFKLLGRFLTFSSGLTETSGAVTLGGTLAASTALTLGNVASATFTEQSFGGKVIFHIANGSNTAQAQGYIGAIGPSKNTYLIFDPYQIQGPITGVPDGVYFTNPVGYSVDISADIGDQIIPRYKDVKNLTVGLQDLPIMAPAMWPRTTNGCAALAKTEMATSIVNIQSLDFDQTTQEFAQFQIVLPRNWNNGTVTAKVYWTASSGSGTVQWGISGGAYSNDDALTVALGTAQTVDDTLIATNDLHVTDYTSAITLAGSPADADFLVFQISRNPASDTLSADAKLLGVVITLTTDSGVAA